MMDGVEGQVWRSGLLAATRWWPASPSARDWATFLRSAGMDLTQATLGVPPVVESDILPAPWTVATTPVTDLWSLVQNERAAAIAAAVVAVPFLYYLTQAIVLLGATMKVESAIAGMSAANQSVRNDRAAALASLDGIGSYLSLEPLPPHFEVMSVATRLLRDKKVVISEWTFDAGNLSILIQGTESLEAPAFIELFERDDHFSEVSATVGNQQRELRLTMKVDSRTWPT